MTLDLLISFFIVSDNKQLQEERVFRRVKFEIGKVIIDVLDQKKNT